MSYGTKTSKQVRVAGEILYLRYFWDGYGDSPHNAKVYYHIGVGVPQIKG